MNRFIKIFCALSLVLVLTNACSVQRGNDGPSLSAWKNAVKGEWTLNSIERENFPDGVSVKTLFDEAPLDCFLDSKWNLTGSGKGSIAFTREGSSCSPGIIRDIFWSLAMEEGTSTAGFQFKRILPGDRAKDVTTGYHLDLRYAGEGRMTMRMPLELGSTNSGFLIFNFSR